MDICWTYDGHGGHIVDTMDINDGQCWTLEIHGGHTKDSNGGHHENDGQRWPS